MSEELQAEIARLDAAVDAFAAKMKAKLRKKAQQGHYGWDDPDSWGWVAQKLIRHAVDVAYYDGVARQMVDTANLAMMLDVMADRREGISSTEATGDE